MRWEARYIGLGPVWQITRVRKTVKIPVPSGLPLNVPECQIPDDSVQCITCETASVRPVPGSATFRGSPRSGGRRIGECRFPSGKRKAGGGGAHPRKSEAPRAIGNPSRSEIAIHPSAGPPGSAMPLATRYAVDQSDGHAL